MNITKFLGQIILFLFILFIAKPAHAWVNVTAAYPNINNKEISGLTSNGNGLVFASSWVDGGTYATTDNGTTWQQVSATYNFTDIFLDLNNQNNLWGANWDNISEIAFNAQAPAITWQILNSGIPASSNNGLCIAVNNTNSNYGICGTILGAYRTFNSGSNWSQIAPTNPNSSSLVICLQQSPWDSDKFYLGGSAGLLLYSWSADTITQLWACPSGTRVNALNCDCSAQGNVFCLLGFGSGDVYYYNNASGTAVYLSNIADTSARSIVKICSCTQPMIFAVGANTYPVRSLDNGNTWQLYNTGLPVMKGNIKLIADSGGYLWLGSASDDPSTADTGHGIFRDNICAATQTPSPTGTSAFTFTSTPTISPTGTISVTFTVTPIVSTTVTPTVINNCLQLYKNSPNPFSDGTNIVYALCSQSDVKIKIYTISGESVFELDQQGQPGMNSFYWDTKNKAGKGVASGTYIYSVEAGEGAKQKVWGKMAVIK